MNECWWWCTLAIPWPWILQPQTSPARIGFDEALQHLALPQPADIIDVQLGVFHAATDSTHRRNHGALVKRPAGFPENGPGGGIAGGAGGATGTVRDAAAQGRPGEPGAGLVY